MVDQHRFPWFSLADMWIAISAAFGLGLAYHFLLPPYALLRKRAADPERWSRLYPPEQLPVVMRALEAISYSFSAVTRR